MLAQVSWSLWSLGQGVRSIGRDRIWLPFAALFALQVLLLLTLTNFFAWPISLVMVPIVRATLGETALHYPYNFLALPFAWSRLAIVVDVALSGFVMAWTYRLFLRSRGEEPPDSRRRLRSWWRFAVARIPFQLALVLVLILTPSWVRGGEDGLGGNALRLFRAATLAVSIGIEALFLYVPFQLLRERLGPSLRDGIAFAGRYPVAVFLLVGLPALAHIPFLWILGRTHLLVQRMAPETVGWLVLANLFLAAVTSYVAVVGAGHFRTAVGRTEQ
ncbi:MAG: hypothetical protein GF355_11110 [Candidatus Eisenbacteria bacterium]|nr:hypothetical protein [Candidatus Eisenbacteria bacterium]